MKLTRLEHHEDHEIRIHLNRFGSTHFAALRCVRCNRHIQWLSAEATEHLANLGVDVKDTYKTTKLNDLDIS
jgi:uncharacterized protein with PIN domain